MQPGGGAIVNTGSSSGLVGEQGMPAYNASKGAVDPADAAAGRRLHTPAVSA